MSAAKSLARTHTEFSLRLMKEIYTPETGELLNVAVFTAGPFGDEDFFKERKEGGKLQCFRPDDFYSLQARITIGQVLEDFLQRHRISAIELIHRSDMLKTLDDSGTTVQHAIQKYILANKTGDSSKDHSALHATIRQLYDLIEKSCARVHKDEAAKRFPQLQPSNFAKCIEKVKSLRERDYLLGGGIAKYLADVEDWKDKIELLSELLDALPEDPALRKIGAGVVDQFLSDIVYFHASIPDMAGHHPHLADALTIMVGVFVGRAKGEGDDDGGGGGAQKYFRPAKCCLKGDLPVTTQTMGKRVLKEIEGKADLHCGFLEEEVVATRKLADLVVWGQGPDVSIDDIKEAFRIRSKRFVLNRALEDFSKKVFADDQKVEKLLGLSENIVGEQNKLALAKYIIQIIRSPQFERFFKDQEKHLINRLMGLTNLQRLAFKAELTEQGSLRVAEELDNVAFRIVSDEKLLNSLIQRPMEPIDRAILLLELCEKGIVTKGAFFDSVKRLILQNMPQQSEVEEVAEYNDELAAQNKALDQKIVRLKSLLHKLNLFQDDQEAA